MSDRPWGSTYVFKKSWEVGRVLIRANMRKSDGIMGRFGGGWNWKLGVQWGSTTVLVSLLVMQLSVSWSNEK